MKVNKVFLFIISLIMLSFDIALIFVLNVFSIKNTSALYIVSKCFSILAFICIILLGMRKTDLASYLLQYCITVILQFMPLIIRYLSTSETGFIISIIVFFVSIIIYLVLVFGLFSLNKKSIKATEELKGREIKLKESDKDE